MNWLLWIIAAYLIGSIPFGVMIGRAKGIDIRQHGSKNIGATNVGRVLGKKLGLLCFMLDMLKGAVPVVVAGIVMGVFGRRSHPDPALGLSQAEMWLWMAVAAATVIGHMFPAFLGFRGGKGVATGFGAVVAMYSILTLPALGALFVWYVSLRLFKFVSLASMLAAISLPLGAILAVIPPDGKDILNHLMHASPPLLGTSIIAMLVIWQHRTNIARLRSGEEPRVNATRPNKIQ